MELVLLAGYLAVSAFFTVMAWIERGLHAGGLRLLLAIGAWPLSLLVVVAIVAAMMVRPRRAQERRYSR